MVEQNQSNNDLDPLDISKFLLLSVESEEFLRQFILADLTLFDTENQEQLILINGSTLREQTQNMINAAKIRDQWLNENMTINQIEEEVAKMN